MVTLQPFNLQTPNFQLAKQELQTYFFFLRLQFKCRIRNYLVQMQHKKLFCANIGYDFNFSLFFLSFFSLLVISFLFFKADFASYFSFLMKIAFSLLQIHFCNSLFILFFLSDFVFIFLRNFYFLKLTITLFCFIACLPKCLSFKDLKCQNIPKYPKSLILAFQNLLALWAKAFYLYCLKAFPSRSFFVMYEKYLIKFNSRMWYFLPGLFTQSLFPNP